MGAMFFYPAVKNRNPKSSPMGAMFGYTRGGVSTSLELYVDIRGYTQIYAVIRQILENSGKLYGVYLAYICVYLRISAYISKRLAPRVDPCRPHVFENELPGLALKGGFEALCPTTSACNSILLELSFSRP